MKFQTRFVILLANGFVAYYYWVAYQHGMPALRILILFPLSLVGVNLAIVLGRKLAERNTKAKQPR